MTDLTVADKVSLVKFYFKNEECIAAAIRSFCTEKRIKKREDYPSRTSVERIINNFLENGSVNNDRVSSKRRSEEDIAEIRSVIERNPSSSCRSLSASTGVSKSKVHNILREDLQLTPYKMQIARHLAQHTREERLQFCHKFLQSSSDNDFKENILFTDEATFDLNPICNKQNCRIWSHEKPEANCFKKTNFPKKQMVWIGFSKRVVVGPYFFSQNVTSDSYCDMIENFVIPELKLKRVFSKTTFQQDGARPHTSKQTMAFLKNAFRSRIISRGSDFIWPGYSPDLSPVDFGFWGFLKSKIYGKNFHTFEELEIALRGAVSEIPSEFYEKTIESITERCLRCIENEGDVFEL